MTLQLKKFNPSKMADDKVCIFIGKRGSGKTTLVTDILWHKRHIPIGVVMSGTEDGNHYYKQFVPDLFIHGDFSKDTIEKILDRQKRIVSSGKETPAFLLLDDCMYDKSYMKETCIRQCFMNGRHWKLFFMLTMQYCMDLSPDLRANVDYIFVMREPVIKNRQRLYENFFGIFPNFKMFSDVFDACTENYECLVFDNTSKSNRIEDCVFYYKAPIRKNFRIGSPAMWTYHQKMYNPKYVAGSAKKPVDKERTAVKKV
jgi:hypothetical protein